MTAPVVVRELTPVPAVAAALRALSGLPGVVLFDSALPHSRLGRYSFLCADPAETFILQNSAYGANPFQAIEDRLDGQTAETLPDLPPFQGGMAGVLSYELGGCFERLPVPRWNEFALPAMAVGLYHWVIAWDHQQNRCWFIGRGDGDGSSSLQQAQLEDRFRSLSQRLSRPNHGVSSVLEPSDRRIVGLLQAPTFAWQTPAGVLSNFDEPGYHHAVQRVIDYIRAGDLFQANLSQRLLFPATLSPLEQYLRLRESNPAPFAGYAAFDDWAILSSSPEQFIGLSDGEVRTRPIKGTRQRRAAPEADLFTRDELRESEKDRAENVMIVDLLRNDLSRVCEAGSIQVPELCLVEAYETVSHLVSEVRGRLRPGATFWDLMRATFPGGSITGAPKIRAMEIITEIEQTARGAYCGSLFYCGFDGVADSNILIRTMTYRNGWLQFSAGGGIVAQSNPQDEYLETLHKAQGMLRSLPRESA